MPESAHRCFIQTEKGQLKKILEFNSNNNGDHI